jgi:hypothetical protein
VIYSIDFIVTLFMPIMSALDEELKKTALRNMILMVKYCGGFSQEDLRKSKFTSKIFQTEGRSKNDRHILDLDLVATIINLHLSWKTAVHSHRKIFRTLERL